MTEIKFVYQVYNFRVYGCSRINSGAYPRIHLSSDTQIGKTNQFLVNILIYLDQTKLIPFVKYSVQ